MCWRGEERLWWKESSPMRGLWPWPFPCSPGRVQPRGPEVLRPSKPLVLTPGAPALCV